jgi:hypothetical protein
MDTADIIEMPRRRRTPSPELLISRDAGKLVEELNGKLGVWQSSSIKLRTMAERLRAAGRRDDAVASEARALAEVVAVQARQFEELANQQSDAIARHFKLDNTRRSLSMIGDRLAETLKLLGE